MGEVSLYGNLCQQVYHCLYFLSPQFNLKTIFSEIINTINPFC